MGVGIYVVWPAFYTDVTDAYRLGKRRAPAHRPRRHLLQRDLRAALAGGCTSLTGFEPLLLLVLIQHFAMLQQLLPLLRLDGYYIISDLTGVPDMFSRIKPMLQSLLPGREASDRGDGAQAVRAPGGDRATCSPWCRCCVCSFGLMLLHAPRAFATAYDSLGVQWDKVSAADGLAAGAAGGIQLAMLVLPLPGIALTTARVGGRLGGGAWRWSEGEPVRRTGLATVAAAGLALLAFTWWPNGEYRPIQPGERGHDPGRRRVAGRDPDRAPEPDRRARARAGRRAVRARRAPRRGRPQPGGRGLA